MLNPVNTLLLLALALAPNAGRADGGISGSGGGNTINDKLVEEYAFDPDQGEAGKIAREKLALLERELPALGRLLRERYEQLTFYAIPEKIKELPVKQTGLAFRSQQLAIHRDGEVFADGAILRRLSPEGRARFYLHEAFMSLQSEKKSRHSRKAVTKLFDRKMSVKSLQLTLVEAQFGPNLSRADIQALAKGEAASYLSGLDSLLAGVEHACSEEASLPELLELLAEAPRPDTEFERRLLSPFRPASSPWEFANRARAGWYKPVSRNRTDVRDLLVMMLFSETGKDRPPPEVSMELYRLLPVERKQDHPELPEQELRFDVARENSVLAERAAEEAREAAILKLAELPAFMNLLALESLQRRQPAANEEASVAGKKPQASSLASLSGKAEKRAQELSSSSEAERRQLACNSVSAVRKEIDRPAPDASAGSSENEDEASPATGIDSAL